MRAVTAAAMRVIDLRAQREYGIPALLLMENAGIGVADEALKLLGRRRGTVAVLCGRGNNGGDGFVAARHLFCRGKKVRVFFFGTPAGLGPGPALNHALLGSYGVPCQKFPRGLSVAALRSKLRGAALIVDALFGTGLSRAPEGPWRSAIEAMNASGAPVLAVDVPSGLDADTGRPFGGPCTRAAVTVTFGLAKRGFRRARAFTGRVIVRDISLPPDLLRGRGR